VSVISNIIYKLFVVRNVPDTPGDLICLSVNENLTYIHVIGYAAAWAHCAGSLVRSFADPSHATKFIRWTFQFIFRLHPSSPKSY